MIATYAIEQDVAVRTGPATDGVLPRSGWIDLIDPSPEECRQAHEELGIPLEHLRAALDSHERPRVEYADNILLLIVRAPVGDETGHMDTLRTFPVAIIVREDLLVTVCLRGDLVSEDLLNRKLPSPGSRPAARLALCLLLRISTTFIQQLQRLDAHVEKIESTLKQSMQNRELLRMMHVEKALIYFFTALKGNHAVLEKFHAGGDRFINQAERDLLDDVIIENKQASDMAEIYIQIIGSLGDTFGAVVSNNLNKAMKILTGLTIVFMVPSIIGSLYGMNVPLPWQEDPNAFTVLCILCLVVSLIVFYILRKKDWM